MNQYFNRYLYNRYVATGDMDDGRMPIGPGMPRGPGMRPPGPPPPSGIPGPYNYRPLNVYLCRYYSTTEAVNYCSYTVAYGDQIFSIRPECSTPVAGPFYTMRDADAYIQWKFGVGRGQTFVC